MPRVANPPRAQHHGFSPQKQSPIKIPLNDDRREKAVRLQSRQALHDLQMNQLRAAASPMRKMNHLERAVASSPRTPGNPPVRGKENMDDAGNLAVVAGSAVTPMKRVPLLANFEEWMKMATDNKINATNSWNFALIDYFHDMSLLKEGDGVNFQKASCTLDGCVKIYTSRVDSVATETGKLLSGLAESGNKRGKPDEEDGGRDGPGDGDEEDGEDAVKKRTKKRAQRSSEATLAPSFASLQLRKFDLEFSVDPLFKKASADFDEGGAKGLLLNHLAIGPQGRIVFDSSDDIDADKVGGESVELKSDAEIEADVSQKEEIDEQDTEVNLEELGLLYFPDLDSIDGYNICPSFRNLEHGDAAANLHVPVLKLAEDCRPGIKMESASLAIFGDSSGIFLNDDNAAGFDDDDGLLAGFEVPVETAFGEGGEVWARDAAIEPQIPPHNRHYEEGIMSGGGSDGLKRIEVGVFDGDGRHAVSLHHGEYEGSHDDILNYFDNTLRKSWAGPEHWRIRRMQSMTKAPSSALLRRKEKEPFEINFASPLDPALAELIYTPAISASAILMPKSQWRSKARNLLPDDRHFNSRQLLRLFLKPKACVRTQRVVLGNQRSGIAVKQEDTLEKDVDEAFWSRQENVSPRRNPGDDGQHGNYDANFFQDDGLAFSGALVNDEDVDFEDARENILSVGEVDNLGETQGTGITARDAVENLDGAFGTQLVTQSRRLRPDYVQYARVAKKVDVRQLKEEIWKGIGLRKDQPSCSSGTPMVSKMACKDDGALKFTSVMNGLQQVYPIQAMADISTSFCFICLLHLANEKGLALCNKEGLQDLSIQQDLTAEIRVDAD